MQNSLLLLHKISVYLFLIIYLLKLAGLLANLASLNNLFAKKPLRILEMIISISFLVSGVMMLVNLPGELISSLLIIKISLIVLVIPLAVIGYKKRNKLLATLSFLGLVAMFGLGEMNKKRPTVKATMATSAIDGRELYIAGNCNICHGENGDAPNTTLGAKNLAESKLNDADIVTIITKGRNNMQGYGKRFDEKQIAQLAEYVKTLRKP